jgi:hypothetical protein
VGGVWLEDRSQYGWIERTKHGCCRRTVPLLAVETIAADGRIPQVVWTFQRPDQCASEAQEAEWCPASLSKRGRYDDTV